MNGKSKSHHSSRTRKAASLRLKELLDVAARVFILKGYRRTRMDDLTRAMGLSPGAIYRYVESKEALFDLLVRIHASTAAHWEEMTIPVVTPRPGATLAFLQKTLASEGRLESLDVALRLPTPSDAKSELEGIVRELYKKSARFRVGIKVLDSAALDWPELASLWSGKWRTSVVKQLALYIESRSSQGLLRRVPEASAWARLLVEIVAFFAMHRHFDPYPTPMNEEVAEETAVQAVSRGLAMPR